MVFGFENIKSHQLIHYRVQISSEIITDIDSLREDGENEKDEDIITQRKNHKLSFPLKFNA